MHRGMERAACGVRHAGRAGTGRLAKDSLVGGGKEGRKWWHGEGWEAR
jgi:hypothetical protein